MHVGVFHSVLLGAHGEKGLQRVARWADGWCPLAPRPDELRDNLKTLRQLMEEAGRDFQQLHISVFLGMTDGTPCADLIKQHEDAGAERVIIMLGHKSGSQAFRYVHFFAPDKMEGLLERLAENSGVL